MQPFDPTKAAAFQTRMVDILNSSFLALAMSVGHLSLPLTPSVSSALKFRPAQSMMTGMITLILTGLLRVLRTRRALVLESLALRHQLAVLQRTAPRPRLRPRNVQPPSRGRIRAVPEVGGLHHPLPARRLIASGCSRGPLARGSHQMADLPGAPRPRPRGSVAGSLRRSPVARGADGRSRGPLIAAA
jgi:hypothetical protein